MSPSIARAVKACIRANAQRANPRGPPLRRQDKCPGGDRFARGSAALRDRPPATARGPRFGPFGNRPPRLALDVGARRSHGAGDVVVEVRPPYPGRTLHLHRWQATAADQPIHGPRRATQTTGGLPAGQQRRIDDLIVRAIGALRECCLFLSLPDAIREQNRQRLNLRGHPHTIRTGLAQIPRQRQRQMTDNLPAIRRPRPSRTVCSRNGVTHPGPPGYGVNPWGRETLTARESGGGLGVGISDPYPRHQLRGDIPSAFRVVEAEW